MAIDEELGKMNKKDAKIIAETITNEQLERMFSNAKEGITDWKALSIINKSITKGTAWNILTKAFDVRVKNRNNAKIIMLMEFGDFIKHEFDIPKKEIKKRLVPFHQEPVF